MMMTMISFRRIAFGKGLVQKLSAEVTRRPTTTVPSCTTIAVLGGLQHHQRSPFSTVSATAATVSPPTKPPKEPILGVGKYKTSTGYVGLAVEPDWYNVTLKTFQALLDRMEASDMPETARFRIDVTKWCNFVIKTVKEHPDDPEAVEDAIQMGQVEELIEMAEDEMIALETYLKARMWELVDGTRTVIDFHPDPMKDPASGVDADPHVVEKLRMGMEAMKKRE